MHRKHTPDMKALLLGILLCAIGCSGKVKTLERTLSDTEDKLFHANSRIASLEFELAEATNRVGQLRQGHEKIAKDFVSLYQDYERSTAAYNQLLIGFNAAVTELGKTASLEGFQRSEAFEQTRALKGIQQALEDQNRHQRYQDLLKLR